MKPTLFLAVLIAASALGLAAHARTITCSGVTRQIALKGPSETVKALAGSASAESKAWRRALDLIETGRPDCVRMAKALQPGADAGFSEGIKIALSRALQRNPSAVLANLGDDLKISDICNDNRIEPTSQQHRTFQRKANAALRRVTAPVLRERRDACLAQLNK